MSVPLLTGQRIWASLIALLLAHFFIVVQAQNAWTAYWLMSDGQQGMAIVTKVRWTGHGGVAYQYGVNQVEYTGADAVRRYKHSANDMSPPAVVGEHLVVYFSASHPWLSRLTLPRTALVPGLPVIILVWLLIACLVITAINPKSEWALNIGTTSAKLFPNR